MTGALKPPTEGADIPSVMIISDEQVRRAVEYLRTSDAYATRDPDSGEPAPQELVDRVVTSVESLPDVRDDRVAEARALLEQNMPCARDVASKLIGRVVSDAIR